jgi:hypothetical protein
MTFSTNSGSVDSLNVFARWGSRPKSFQIHPIVDFDNPDRVAIDVRDQCVASHGLDFNVATTTSSTRSGVTGDGRPGRSSSTSPTSPSRPSRTNRARHSPTVGAEHFTSTATCLFVASGSAQASTIRARNANGCDDLARRVQRGNWVRAASVYVSSALVVPFVAYAKHIFIQRTSGAGHQEIVPRSAFVEAYDVDGGCGATALPDMHPAPVNAAGPPRTAPGSAARTSREAFERTELRYSRVAAGVPLCSFGSV